MSALEHADVIMHMAKHGFDSVEGREYQNIDCPWEISTDVNNPTTCPSLEWRIKPTTITYTVTVPEPMREMPKAEQQYWYISGGEVYLKSAGDNKPADNWAFESGNMWDSKEKAKAAFEAFFAPLRKKPDSEKVLENFFENQRKKP